MWEKLFRRKDIESIRRELREVELGPESGRLTKNLTLFDLVCFGIAAIIGAGIFSTIGSAAAAGGPERSTGCGHVLPRHNRRPPIADGK